MSRKINPLVVPKPTEITLETLPQLFAHHRSTWGGWTMTAGPPEPAPPAQLERPDGVSEEEWTALGDPGRQAIVRERTARLDAERQLAASRARPRPPGGPTPAPPPAPAPAPTGGPAPAPADQPDLQQIIEQAVQAAVKPFQDAEERREADQFAEKVRNAVIDAAKDRFYDTGDALTGVDLTKLTNGSGGADAEKIKTALDELLTAKPHLGKPSDPRRRGEPGSGSGGPTGDGNIDDRVQASLARMQASVPGVKFAKTSTT